MSDYTSRAYYLADGVTALWAVPFPYLLKTHVQILDNGGAVDPTHITWTTPSSITISPDIAAGHVLTIQRVTPQDAMLSQIQKGTILPADINTDNLQLLYLIQETADQAAFDLAAAGGGGGDGLAIVATSFAALKAQTLGVSTAAVAYVKSADATPEAQAAAGVFQILSASPGAEDGGTRFASTGVLGFYYNRISDRHQLQLDWFGVKLGTSTGLAAGNDTAIARWLGELGNSKKRGYFPAGIITYNTDIVIPPTSIVSGAGQQMTVLRPNEITTSGIAQMSGSGLEYLTIDGTLCPTKHGHDLGNAFYTSSGYKKVNNGFTRYVNAINFGGVGGVGFQCARVDAWDYDSIVGWGDNTDGFWMGSPDTALAFQDFLPTEITLFNSYFKQNKRYGMRCYNGSFIIAERGSYELNGDAGIFADDAVCLQTNPMEDFFFVRGHIEQNQQTYLAAHGDVRSQFNVVINMASNDGRADGFVFEDFRFVSPDNANYAKPITITNCRDSTIRRPGYNSQAGGYVVNGAGDSAVFEGWSASKCGEPTTMIVDNTVDGGVQFAGYERDLDVSADVVITLAGDLALTAKTYKAKIYRRNRMLRFVGVLTFTPTYTGTPGPLIVTCADLLTASNKTNAPARWKGTASFDKINQAGKTTYWSYVDKNTASMKFKAEATNVAVAQVNIEDLPSGVPCTITFEVEYELKFAGTVG